MTGASGARRDMECSLIWKLARVHGWSSETPVSDLARDANVTDEKKAREVAQNQLSDKKFVGYHPGKDTIWLEGPPSDDVFYHLRDECGYSEIQIDATFGSYFDGF